MYNAPDHDAVFRSPEIENVEETIRLEDAKCVRAAAHAMLRRLQLCSAQVEHTMYLQCTSLLLKAQIRE